MARPPKVRDNQLVEVVDSDNREGFLITTPEVAEELDIDRRTASNRLKALEEKGEVVSEPHGRTTGWRLPMERIVKPQPTEGNDPPGYGNDQSRPTTEVEPAVSNGKSNKPDLWETSGLAGVGKHLLENHRKRAVFAFGFPFGAIPVCLAIYLFAGGLIGKIMLTAAAVLVSVILVLAVVLAYSVKQSQTEIENTIEELSVNH